MPDVDIQNNWHLFAEDRLSVLVGTRLTEMHRCLDMEMFGFGPLRSVIAEHGPKKGKVIEKSEFSIHVQCPWRITKNSRIVTGEQDRLDLVEWFDTSELSSDEVEKLPRWLERRVTELQASRPNGLLVTRVVVDELKGLEIGFEDDYVLSVFPASSVPDEYSEYWRFFSSGDQSHLVAYPNEI